MEGVRRRERRALAKAITLLESTRADHRARADALLNALLPHTGQAMRLGISGVPGVGKSTFIEALGLCLIAQGPPRRGAGRRPVVAASPAARSSATRRAWSCCRCNEAAYIRPSPASRHARRRGREDARGDAGVRGGGLRRGDRRDRRRRPERDRGGRHDRHVRAAAVAQRRRRPAGDQEGRDGAGRPGRHQQGRHRPRRRHARARRRSPARCASSASTATRRSRRPLAAAGDAAQRAEGAGRRRVLGAGRALPRSCGAPAASSTRAASSRRWPGCGTSCTPACAADFRPPPRGARRRCRRSCATSTDARVAPSAAARALLEPVRIIRKR